MPRCSRLGPRRRTVQDRKQLVEQGGARRGGDVRRHRQRAVVPGEVHAQLVAGLVGHDARPCKNQRYEKSGPHQCCVTVTWLPAPPLCVTVALWPEPLWSTSATLWLAAVPRPYWLIVATREEPDCRMVASFQVAVPVPGATPLCVMDPLFRLPDLVIKP